MTLLIFEKDNVSFKLLEVLELKQTDIENFNTGRNFEALSFGIDADTVIKQGKNTFRLIEKSVCYFPAGVDYTRIAKKEDIIVIHFISFGYAPKGIEVFYPKESEKIENLFKEILQIWEKQDDAYKYTCTALLYKIFAEIYKQAYKDDVKNSKIRDAVLYINENFTNPQITVKDAAERANMSEVYFRKLFKDEFSVSPKKYIIYLRIKQAAALITMGYYTLSQISEMCGFTDYKYFSTEFKQVVGVTPSKYFYNYPEIAKKMFKQST